MTSDKEIFLKQKCQNKTELLYNSIKSLCSSEDITKTLNNIRYGVGKRCFATKITKHGTLLRIYKEFLQLNNKRQRTRKMGNRLEEALYKEVIQMKMYSVITNQQYTNQNYEIYIVNGITETQQSKKKK